MKNKNLRWLPFAGFLMLAVSLLLFAFGYFHFYDSRLHLIFCDVGQGDAILASFNSSQILIDAGPAGEKGKLLACLRQSMPIWDRKIEVLLNTHPEEDHFGSMTEVTKRYRIGYFITAGIDNLGSFLFQDFKKELLEQKIYTKNTPPIDRFRVGKIYFEILNSGMNFSDSLNDSSIVVLLKFGDFNALLPGDVSALMEQILVWRKLIPAVDVLKVAHHGSAGSTSDELVAATRPKLAVISVGKNSFGHPRKEVIEKLEKAGIKILRTDEEGIIRIISNGKKWEIK